MKGYHGWCELRAKIVAIMKTKMQLILGKKTPWKRTNLQKMNVSKTWGNHSHSKVRENALTLTLKGFLLFAHWRGSQKYKTVSFRPDCFSYAIQEKFTAWRVNSTLNCAWKTDILRFVQYRFLAWNSTWNSLVRQLIFLWNEPFQSAWVILISWSLHGLHTLSAEGAVFYFIGG